MITDTAPNETTLEAGGNVKGVAVALVKQNKDSTGQGRVKVSYPWHSESTESYWARVATPMTGGKRGVYFIPEVGDEVLVAFERGDMRFPYVIGSLWNGKDKAAQNNGDGKNDIREIRTRADHTLTFNDGSDGFAQLRLSPGHLLRFKNDEVRLEDPNGNSIVFANGEIKVTAATRITLTAPQIAIESSGTTDVKAGATLGLRGTVVNIN
jgi:uncharacterized protein involved in type VI secretion and phage assembly